MKLTVTMMRSAAIPAGKSEAIFFDDDLPGFGLRLREGGSRSFVFQYKLGTKHRRIALGAATGVNLAKVRKTAEQLYARVKLGQDPATDKAEAQARAAQTFRVALDQYLAQQRARLRPRTYPDLERHLLKHGKPLHGLQLAKITRADIAAIIISVSKNSGQVTANRVRASLSSFFSWAMQQGSVDANPVIGTARHKEQSRDRVLSPSELRLIWKALDDDDDFGAIVKVLALTGQRASEIAGLRWSEISDDTIVLPGDRTKNHRPHILPLSEPVVAILAARTKRDNRELIFGRGAKPFSGWSKCKQRLDAKLAKAGAKFAHWTLHDFRRTFATFASGGLPEHQLKMLPPRDREAASGLGIEPHVIQAVLGHVSGYRSGVAGVYNRSTSAREKKAALDRWADRLLAIVEDRASNVVPLKA